MFSMMKNKKKKQNEHFQLGGSEEQMSSQLELHLTKTTVVKIIKYNVVVGNNKTKTESKHYYQSPAFFCHC